MSAGIPGGVLAKSLVWELGLLALTGSLFLLLAMPTIFPLYSIAAGVSSFIAITAIVTIAAWRYVSIHVARAVIRYVGFLGISGFLFVAVVGLVTGWQEKAALSFLGTCGAYVVAWLAGFVTPGAPAGIGVRELVVLFFARGSVAEADLVVAILLGRVVTVIGDVIFFAMVSFGRAGSTLRVGGA